MRSSFAVAAFAACLSLVSSACGGSDPGDPSDSGGPGGGGDDAGGGAASGGDAAGADATDTAPRAGENEACSFDEHCEEPLVCRALKCAGFDCPHVCVRTVESCVGDACGPNAYCVGIWDKSGGTCMPRGELGAACSMSPGGDPDVNTCVEGAFCASIPGGGKCTKAFAAGATCPSVMWVGANQFACVDGYTCVSAVIGDPGKCVRVRRAGQPCMNGSDCAHGLYCSQVDDTCKPRIAVGGACADAKAWGGPSQFSVCVAGSQCTGGVCIP
jgi:hypothetical protein